MLLPLKLWNRTLENIISRQDFYFRFFFFFIQSPLADAFSRLEEASVISLFESVVSLSDE